MGSGDKILVDTNIIIYILEGHSKLLHILNGKILAYSVISEIELLGYHGLTNKEEVAIQAFLADCYPLEMTSQIRALAIEFRRKFRMRIADAIIAATAYYHNYSMISADSDFLKVDGLYLLKYEL